MVTTARAKELRRVAENVVTYAKKGNTLHCLCLLSYLHK
jgi:ribosomal protein L17